MRLYFVLMYRFIIFIIIIIIIIINGGVDKANMKKAVSELLVSPNETILESLLRVFGGGDIMGKVPEILELFEILWTVQ